MLNVKLPSHLLTSLLIGLFCTAVVVGCAAETTETGMVTSPTESPATATPLESTPTVPPPSVTPEPSPTATLVPTITPTTDLRAVTAETKRVTLSENSPQTVNEHAHSELRQRGGGGGSGLGCWPDEERYVWRVYVPNNRFKIHEKGQIGICIDPDDSGVFTIYDALGHIVHQEEFAPDPDSESAVRMIAYEWETDILVDPLGTYRAVIDSTKGIIEQEVDVYSPDEPRLIWRTAEDVILTGFEPNEAVVFFIYEKTDLGYAPLLATVAESTDQDGALIVTFDFATSVATLAVRGDVSGRVHPNRDSSISNGFFDPIFWPISESGVEACHLKNYVTGGEPEIHILTATADLFDESIATMPATDQPQEPLATLAAGTQVTIVDGRPVWHMAGSDSEAGGWLWLVAYENGRGYIWEGHIEGC